MDHNKQIVTDFYQQIFIKGNLSVLANYMHDNYIQHNPTVENGRQGFFNFMQKFLQFKPQIDILNITCENDMVYVFFKCTLANGHINKVCDIYRLHQGKLAEHWDVIEHNVENIESINGNSIF